MEHHATYVTEAQREEQLKAIRAFREMEDRPESYFIVTYGCQMNAHDSEKLAGLLEEMGMSEAEDRTKADLVLFNTCCVRDNAERRALGNVTWLKELKKEKPRLLIGVCGCMVQQPGMAEKILKQYRFIDLAFGTHNLHELPGMLVRLCQQRTRVVSISHEEDLIAEGLPVKRLNSWHAYITIMYGCNNFCSYCIVPYVRGRERSRRPDEILEEVRALVAAGYKDITLLGQNVNSYGKDLDCGVDFADLLAEIAQLPGQFWLRFMTSHPKDASHKLFDTIAKYPKIAKQFHLPFQSGNDRVLKAMNRHYDSAQYLELVHYGRALMPDLVLTSDVIVGFPGETEEEFEDTIKLIEHVRYDALFTFIFSPRGGTPAAKMEDPTPKEEKNRRFDRLCEVQNRISLEIHQNYIGKTMLVLVDGKDGDQLTARTEGGRLVRMHGGDELIGQFVHAKITGCTTWSLVGELAE